MLYPFTQEAKTHLRAINRPLCAFWKRSLDFGETGTGDVEPMRGEWQSCYRLRIGEYRVIFRYIAGGLEILTVGHRSDVYK